MLFNNFRMGSSVQRSPLISSQPEYLRPEVRPLLKLLAEATRARPQGVPGVFIRPAGTDHAEADYNHFVFGQRGSGKSSLLRYLENLMRQQHRVAVWIDLEIFTDLSYPEVLVSCVLEIVEGITESLKREGKITTHRGLARLKRGRGNVRADTLESRLDRMSSNLRVMKSAQFGASIEWVHKVTSNDQLDALGSVKAGAVGVSIGSHGANSSEITTTQTVVTSKGEYLERSLVDFRKVIREAADVTDGGFVFVDDLYLVARSDQPRVLGYLHRLLKDSGFWLKIGSIRHATNNFLSSDRPVGMLPCHPAHDVAVDRQFSFFDTTRSFLEEILGKLAAAESVNDDRLDRKSV